MLCIGTIAWLCSSLTNAAPYFNPALSQRASAAADRLVFCHFMV
jgi:hypothetical protein